MVYGRKKIAIIYEKRKKQPTNDLYAITVNIGNSFFLY